MADEPNPLYYAQFPLQEQIWDRDGTGPLAAGVVSYFSDPDFTIPKNVFEQSNNPVDGSFVYTNIGSVLTLSSIGTFVDDDGNNFIPFLYPYDSDGEYEPYYIRVESSGAVLQFTVTGWPPNQFAETPAEAGGTDTANLLTNPQFNTVLFANTPGTSSYIFAVSGTNTVTQIAPSWYINTSGSGNVTVSQQSLNAQTPSDAPYALRISPGTGVTCSLYQRIFMSPRLLAGNDIAGYFEVSNNSSAVDLALLYIPSAGSGGTTVSICDGVAPTGGAWTSIFGTAEIESPFSTASATGYVDISLAIPTNADLSLTSFQITGTSDINVDPEFIQITTPQQQSELFYYYQPQLNYKPIPSYTIGWDFPFNPGQELGASGGPYTIGANNDSKYIADQTILFQSVDNTLSFTLSKSTGLTIICGATPSSFALIQYLDQASAVELLNQRNAVCIKSNTSTGTLVGQVHLLWTQNASIPTLPLSALTAVDATTGLPSLTSGWSEVPRDTLGTAYFSNTTTATQFNLSGWDAAAVSGINSAKWFAVVLTFPALSASQHLQIQYCSLCGGDIATPPAPLSQEQTLNALQAYYETNYDYGVIPGTSGAHGYANSIQTYNGSSARPASFSGQWKIRKRIDPTESTFHLYSPSAGTINNVDATAIVLGIRASDPTPQPISGNWELIDIGENGFTYRAESTANIATTTGTVNDSYISYFWSVDSRFGIV